MVNALEDLGLYILFLSIEFIDFYCKQQHTRYIVNKCIQQLV